jgi:hypothetical protein
VDYDPELLELEEAVQQYRDMEQEHKTDMWQKIRLCELWYTFKIIREDDYFILCMWIEE